MSETIASFPRKRPAVIAHRGASAYAPENTLASFQKAIDMKADYFELDVQLTRDGSLAVFHDREISRFSVKRTSVVDMSMIDMRKLDVGSWFGPEFADQRVICLEEALELADDKIGVYVELKSAVDETPASQRHAGSHPGAGRADRPGLADLRDAATASAPRVLSWPGAIDVIRPYADRVRIVAQAFPPSFRPRLPFAKPRHPFRVPRHDLEGSPISGRDFVLFERRRVAGFNVNKGVAGRGVSSASGTGAKSCAIWVVDEPEDMRRLADLGVNALISNKPDVCLGTLEAWSSQNA